MKVECNRIINAVSGDNMSRSPWLTIGKAYVVLSVEIFASGEIAYRIIGDSSPSPVLFDAKQFRIIHNHMPSNWVIEGDYQHGFSLQPARWFQEGFWEDFFNNVSEAIRIFEEEEAVIITES